MTPPTGLNRELLNQWIRQTHNSEVKNFQETYYRDQRIRTLATALLSTMEVIEKKDAAFKVFELNFIKKYAPGNDWFPETRDFYNSYKVLKPDLGILSIEAEDSALVAMAKEADRGRSVCIHGNTEPLTCKECRRDEK